MSTPLIFYADEAAIVIELGSIAAAQYKSEEIEYFHGH
jgi:hypothetical protein